MTIITKTPQNPNPLHPNKFQLTFSRAPHIQYFCQSVSVPGISLSEVPRQTPFVDLYSPGEKAIYDVFNITFMVDEYLSGWLEIHDWIRAMTFPEKFEEYLHLQKQSRYVGNPKTPQF
jgi:2-C-methyl-D-erythritol 4-phosphate cytidylyltransferase